MFVAVCEICGGGVIQNTDGWPRCASCGRDPDYPGRSPTADEKQELRELRSGGQTRDPVIVARNDTIIALYESGVSAAVLAGRYGLSKTRIVGIVKYGQ